MTEQSIRSSLKTIDINSAEVTLLLETEALFEAPNWSPCGEFLIYNQQGHLYRFDLATKTSSLINTDFAGRCNNDHGISPDGKQIVISHHFKEGESSSVIYTLPIEGGVPQQVTQQWPSYWHGWSPDGQTLTYVGKRDEDYSIYGINVKGGDETRLTFSEGLDDGPEYSADGQHIYYNSFASGMMQIWRMRADGTEHTQLIESPHSDWFPHPSPDGKKLVFIRYMQDQRQGHPFGQDVKLMLFDIASQQLTDLTPVFFGGQGTINVPSWSPDSAKIAFVSYQLV
ncbi:hypothetical protein QX776_17900 [Alteromonadaceae bacterium BrNp21-10]|nr:hypothetical protein [Alteromonadaceae bacterium BrNp21-10]